MTPTVLIFARGLISGGLDGMPRRTFLVEANCSKDSWALAGALTGIGGTLMTLGALMFVLVIIAYGPFFLGYLPPNLVSPGFRIF